MRNLGESYDLIFAIHIVLLHYEFSPVCSHKPLSIFVDERKVRCHKYEETKCFGPYVNTLKAEDCVHKFIYIFLYGHFAVDNSLVCGIRFITMYVVLKKHFIPRQSRRNIFWLLTVERVSWANNYKKLSSKFFVVLD